MRRRNPHSNRNTLIDAAILTLGLSLLSWILLITPYLHDPTLGLLPKLVSVAYPLGDILLLAAAIRLVARQRPAAPGVLPAVPRASSRCWSPTSSTA